MNGFKIVDQLLPEEIEVYTRALSCYKPQLVPTGEVIEERGEESAISRVVISGTWTPYGHMRDCGDHYIIARYSRYDRVSKDLQTITEDCEDY